MLQIVGQDADQPYAQAHRGIPALVHDPLEVLGGQPAHELQGLFVHGVVVPGQQVTGVDPHLGDLRGAVPVPRVPARQIEPEALLPVLREPDLVEPRGVRDMVVLDAGEVPDQP